MARAATQVDKVHPKLLAVMQPRGTSRGRARTATIAEPAQMTAFVAPEFVPEPPKVDPTKVAADAFAQAHPEGTKALLAKLLREREEADRVYVVDGAAFPAVTATVARHRPTHKPTPEASEKPVPVASEPVAVAGTDEPLAATDPEKVAPGAGQLPGAAEPVEPVVIIPVAAKGTPQAAAIATREAWLLAAVEAMRSWFPDDSPVPVVRISIGWPVGSGRKAGFIRGQCFYATEDDIPAIFVSPDQNDSVTVLGIVLHEMVHAAGQRDHKAGGFGKVAGALGFVKPWVTSEGKTPELVDRLTALVEQLGPINHAKVRRGDGKLGPAAGAQTTRMVKLTCPSCGYQVRTTRKWIDVGLPLCPRDDDALEPSAEDMAKLRGDTGEDES